MQNRKDEVSAHPTSTITLDEGGSHEFILPTDAHRLKEQILMGDPRYQDFLQGERIAGALTKLNLESYSEQSLLHFESVQRTGDGNWVMGINFRQDWYTQQGEPRAYQKYIVKVNNDGEILNIYNVASGEDFFTSSNNTDDDLRLAVDGGGLVVEAGRVSMWYLGYSPNEEDAILRHVTLNENLDPASASYTEGDFSGNPTPGIQETLLFHFIKKILISQNPAYCV